MGDHVALAPHRLAQPVPSAAQARIISAALELFARNGVGGTSLQMIADTIGVTKAAVYHQYNTKDEIVLAAAEAELARVQAVVDAAEAEPSQKRARETLVTGIVDLAVAHRRTVSTMLNDPVIARFFAEHESFHNVMDRLTRVLMGDDTRTRRARLDCHAHRRHQRYGPAPARRRA
jgi:AcrR family transcriptional regulator